MQSAKILGAAAWRDWLTAAALAALAVAVFYPVTGYSFVNYDDPVYSYSNPHVRDGLSWPNALWSLKTLEFGPWHPLTWLSLQADASLYGPGPFGFHLTNVLLHAANVALLFFALRTMTGAFWQSLAVALLFAVHPLQVEPVAWVSERKGVLSVFFALLMLQAYAKYAQRSAWWLYAAVLVAFCASLMSKPALVMLPLLLLVLDWWPLRRLTLANWRRPVAEKLPLLIVATLISAFAYVAQSQAQVVVSLPLSERAANAVTRCFVYLRQTVWPTGLAVHYPLQSYTDGAAAFVLPALGLLGLLGLTAAALALRHTRPYLLVGWLWFVGMLAPVIIVQISRFGHADRYNYFPQIGILIALSWGVADLAGRHAARVLPVAAVVAAGVLVTLTRAQLPTWHDSRSLWEAARRTTGDSSMTLMKLGETLEEEHRLEEAARCYSGAVLADPDLAVTHACYSRILARLNRLPEAEIQLRDACRLEPLNALSHAGLAVVFREEGRLVDAASEFREAVRLNPGLFQAHCDLGAVELKRGRVEQAAEAYGEALRLEPKSAEAHAGLADALLKQGHGRDAVDHLRASVALEPSSPWRHYQLGTALEALGALDEGARSYEQAVRLNARMAAAWYNLGLVRSRQEKWPEAAFALAGAVQLDPGSQPFGTALQSALTHLAESGQPDQARRIREMLNERLQRDRQIPR